MLCPGVGVVRIDPQGDRVVAVVSVGPIGESIAVGAGGVWVVCCDQPVSGSRAGLIQVDPAANAAFIDGFGLALLAGAVLLAAGAIAVLWRLPSHDAPAQPPEVLSHPQPISLDVSSGPTTRPR